MAGNLPDLWWGLVALGLCAGVLSGTLGLGSGTLLIPALVLLFHCPQKSAQGTALAVMVPMALVGAIRYKLNPAIEVNTAAVCLLAIGAVTGAMVGVELASRVPVHVLRRIFAVFLIVVAVRMLVTSVRKPSAADGGRTIKTETAQAE